MTPEEIKDNLTEKLGAAIEWTAPELGDSFATVEARHWRKTMNRKESIYFVIGIVVTAVLLAVGGCASTATQEDLAAVVEGSSEGDVAGHPRPRLGSMGQDVADLGAVQPRPLDRFDDHVDQRTHRQACNQSIDAIERRDEIQDLAQFDKNPGQHGDHAVEAAAERERR